MPEEPTAVSITPLANKLSDLKVTTRHWPQFNMRSVIKGGGDLLVENKENVKNSLEQYRVYSVIGPRTTLRAELDHDGNYIHYRTN